MNSKDTLRVGRVIPNVARDNKSPQETITRLYLIALARRPHTDELNRMMQFIEKYGKETSVYGDILWSLINSTEFITNH